jgi:hypothetical protein
VTIGDAPILIENSDIPPYAATLTTTALPVGTSSVTATYGGNTYYAASTSSKESVTITRTADGGAVDGGGMHEDASRSTRGEGGSGADGSLDGTSNNTAGCGCRTATRERVGWRSVSCFGLALLGFFARRRRLGMIEGARRGGRVVNRG